MQVQNRRNEATVGLCKVIQDEILAIQVEMKDMMLRNSSGQKNIDFKELTARCNEAKAESFEGQGISKTIALPSKIREFRDALLSIVANCITARSTVHESLDAFKDAVPIEDFEFLRYKLSISNTRFRILIDNQKEMWH